MIHMRPIQEQWLYLEGKGFSDSAGAQWAQKIEPICSKFMKTRSYIHMMHIAKEVFAKVQAFCQSSAAPPSLEGRVEWLQWAVHLVVNHKCELFDRNPSLLVSQQQEQAFEEDLSGSDFRNVEAGDFASS